jgi:DNA repair protein RadC
METTPTNSPIAYHDTFIREVRATYHRTDTPMATISGPADATAFIRSVLLDNSREHFIALYLDGAHQIACYSIVAIGTANQCPIHPREIFQRAILSGAVAVIVAHNHPSGSLTPSHEDIKLTKRLKEAGELLGISVLDHLIISDIACEAIIAC